MHYFDQYGWYTSTPMAGREADVAPDNTSETTTPGALRANWTGYEWVEVAYKAPLPDVPNRHFFTADELRTALTYEYERRMQAIAAGYPPSERESWPVQTSEAYALLADSTAQTPWIDSAASARGLDRLELAQRIVAKDAQYRVISGTLSGVRQRIEDQIDAAGDDQAALQAIDVTKGWPE